MQDILECIKTPFVPFTKSFIPIKINKLNLIKV